MRKRRNENRGLAAGAARIAVSLRGVLWASITRRPVDAFALLAALVGSAVVIVNALVFQTAARPAPFMANAPLPPANSGHAKSVEAPPSRSAEAMQPTRTPTAARYDPIAELIGMSSRVLAVQRVLSEYGYGQIRRSGVLDPPTVAAIERFEREHKLPVTGRITDHLVSELAAMAGHPL